MCNASESLWTVEDGELHLTLTKASKQHQELIGRC